MPAALNLTGKKFGRWTVVGVKLIRRENAKYRLRKWLCRCECGNTNWLGTESLTHNRSKSCGCLARELSRERAAVTNLKHGYHGTPIYRIWQNMKSRCVSKKPILWRSYGGRGIKVCERWMDFKNFLADMGERPAGLEIDRIDNDGDYEPGNCRWATKSENCKNRRKHFRVNGAWVTQPDTKSINLVVCCRCHKEPRHNNRNYCRACEKIERRKYA